MSNNHNREYEFQKYEEFHQTDDNDKKIEIIDELRENEFIHLANELETEIACDLCGKANCICDEQYMEAVDK